MGADARKKPEMISFTHRYLTSHPYIIFTEDDLFERYQEHCLGREDLPDERETGSDWIYGSKSLFQQTVRGICEGGVLQGNVTRSTAAALDDTDWSDIVRFQYGPVCLGCLPENVKPLMDGGDNDQRTQERLVKGYLTLYKNQVLGIEKEARPEEEVEKVFKKLIPLLAFVARWRRGKSGNGHQFHVPCDEVQWEEYLTSVCDWFHLHGYASNLAADLSYIVRNRNLLFKGNYRRPSVPRPPQQEPTGSTCVPNPVGTACPLNGKASESVQGHLESLPGDDLLMSEEDEAPRGELGCLMNAHRLQYEDEECSEIDTFLFPEEDQGISSGDDSSKSMSHRDLNFHMMFDLAMEALEKKVRRALNIPSSIEMKVSVRESIQVRLESGKSYSIGKRTIVGRIPTLPGKEVSQPYQWSVGGEESLATALRKVEEGLSNLIIDRRREMDEIALRQQEAQEELLRKLAELDRQREELARQREELAREEDLLLTVPEVL